MEQFVCIHRTDNMIESQMKNLGKIGKIGIYIFDSNITKKLHLLTTLVNISNAFLKHNGSWHVTKKSLKELYKCQHLHLYYRV